MRRTAGIADRDEGRSADPRFIRLNPPFVASRCGAASRVAHTPRCLTIDRQLLSGDVSSNAMTDIETPSPARTMSNSIWRVAVALTIAIVFGLLMRQEWKSS